MALTPGDTTREHIIVLRVLNDDGSRTWWEALGLPDPAYWNTDRAFDPKVYVSIEVEKEVKRDAGE